MNAWCDACTLFGFVVNVVSDLVLSLSVDWLLGFVVFASFLLLECLLIAWFGHVWLVLYTVC